MRVRVTYHNWKNKDKIYTIEGVEASYVSTTSERIVIITKTGVHEDIIKTTILQKEYII